MRQRVFGDVVTAGDLEALAPDVGPTDFVRLCGALVGTALADRAGAFTLPEITERITVPDGGVDALYVAPSLAGVSESGGLVGPGTTVYQFKYRDVRRGRRGVVTELATTRDEFAKVGGCCDRYVLLTNVDLSRASRTRLRQRFLDACPSFLGKTLVIWGASELAIQINLVPRLRHLFISDGRLCTLDVAEQEHRALWERRGWPGLVGRGRELEAIESFLNSREARVLRLAGVRHAGKTRLALEALRSRATQVVWASSPQSATIELFRDLDQDDRGAVLIVDSCTHREGDEVAELARARRQLKTVVIEEGGEVAAPVDQLALLVGPLDEDDARRLVAGVTPGLAFTQVSWIVEAAGRLPGLLVEVAALVREAELEPTGRPGTVRQQLDTLMEHLYLSPITADVELRRALGVLSLLPEVGVDGNMGGELDALCHVLGVNVDDVRSRIGVLVRHGLVRRRGRFAEVIPPSLAERLAAETLGRPDLKVAELLVAVEPSIFMRFLRRLRDLARPGVAGAIERLLGQWFPDSESVVRNAHVLRTLAPAAPAVALRCLENGLGTLSSDELRQRLAGDARRDVVETLAPLAHLAETFEGASRLLLSLAEAENERWANNATGEFVSMFGWGRPEVSVSLAQRAMFLREHPRSPQRRRLIGRACGEGLSPRSTVAYHSPAGPEIPPRPALPNTWGELWSYQNLLLGVVRRLSEDADPGVRDVATDAIVNGFADIVRGTMTRERLEEPGGAAFEALGHVARSTGKARVRETAVTRLEVLLDDLKEQQTDAGAALTEVTERASGLLRELTEGELKDELWRWVGPRSQHVLKLEVAGDDEPSRRVQQVARRFSEDLPQLSIHLPWLFGEEAEKRTAFFEALGEALAESGRAESGIDLLTTQVDSPAWPQALGGFCLGWARHDPARVETALDGLLEVSRTWKGVLVASAWLLPSRTGMCRLGKLVERTDVTRVDFTRELAWSVPWDRLQADEVAQLLHTIDDGSRQVRERLLVALGLSAVRGAEPSARLLELSWSFLESTTPGKRESGWRPWDMLASRLVDIDPVRVLALLKAALREYVEHAAVLEFEDTIPLTWSRLISKNRAGLVRVMLEAMLGRDPSVTMPWALRELVRPLDDRETLLGFVAQVGVEGARLVAGALEAGHPGFWELARDLLTMSGGDQGVQAGLNRSVLSGTWSGSAVPWIESRLAGARELAAVPDVGVSSWARRMVSTLERWRMEEEHTDDEPWIWETRMQRREVERLLAREDSPERLWAIGRLLADAPAARVRELLSADEILEVLPRLSDVPEKKRKQWETWARHWSGRH